MLKSKAGWGSAWWGIYLCFSVSTYRLVAFRWVLVTVVVAGGPNFGCRSAMLMLQEHGSDIYAC